MYENPKLKMTKEVKLRLSEPVDDLAALCAEEAGVQKAVWVRKIVEAHLADQGYEIPGYRRVVALRA